MAIEVDIVFDDSVYEEMLRLLLRDLWSAMNAGPLTGPEMRTLQRLVERFAGPRGKV